MSSAAPEPAPRRWSPIDDLSADRSALQRTAAEVAGLRRAWTERRKQLESEGALSEFLRRLVRLWCIETGVIEGLYTVSRGVTQTLVERGFDAAFISHDDTNVPAAHLIDVLRDHERAVEGLFSFVKDDRQLSTSYIKELHQVLTAHQAECDGIDQFGVPRKVPLIRGDWKRLPNNPGRADTGELVHEYHPPEHVAAEMDRLIAMHLSHSEVEPEVESAWLHHRFTQIHPFQDGNGRIARALASLVLIRGRGFPLVIERDRKPEYIDALRAADAGDLAPLVGLVCSVQKEALLQAMDDSARAVTVPRAIPAILTDAVERLKAGAVRRPDVLRSRSTVLVDRASRIADDIGGQISTAIREVPPSRVEVRRGDGQLNSSYGQRIIETAEQIGYRPMAELGDQRVVVEISHGSGTLIAISFHFVSGADPLVMAACAAVLFRGAGDSDWTRSEPACTDPFTFTADRDPEELGASFDEWVERAFTLGLEIWRRSL